jgi:choline dehydrogenase
MGSADAKWAVVDDQPASGLQGLRVVDASVMPRMIRPLNASTLMIADKASDMIRGKAALEAVRFAETV